MSAPSVAIVILNWNGKNFLEQFLPFVCKSSYSNYQIFVADNGSADDSLSFLQTHYPFIKTICLQENYGFAKGYNEALKQVQTDYYVLLNSDVEVTADWLQPMINLLENDASIGACQPKILSFHKKNYFEYAGAAGGWLDRLGYPFAKGRIVDVCEEDKGQYNEAAPVFWASGAALFIRSAIFHSVKGFDEYFFAHQEEIDLCWRIQLSGYKIYACPHAVVYHVGGGTLPQGNSLKTYLNFRNNHIMLFKNVSTGARLWLIPVRFLLDLLSACKGLITGDSGYFTAIIKAHFAFVKWCLFHRNQSIFPAKKTARLSGLYRGSILWQHFVKKKSRFSQIVGKSS